MKTVKISMVVATACCVALSGVVLGAQEKIPARQRDGAAGAKALTGVRLRGPRRINRNLHAREQCEERGCAERR